MQRIHNSDEGDCMTSIKLYRIVTIYLNISFWILAAHKYSEMWNDKNHTLHGLQGMHWGIQWFKINIKVQFSR